MQQQQSDRRDERGTVMVIATLAAGALILFMALALDVGFVWSSRTQSQNVADAAALAAAGTMLTANGTQLNLGGPTPPTGAFAAAQNYAASNSTVANPSVVVTASDITFGTWNFQTQTLDPAANPTDPTHHTGARVVVRQDGSDNARSPAFLSGLLGISGFDVVNTAVGYLGYEGEWDPAEFDLPIGIDSCALLEGGTPSPGNSCGGSGPCALGNPIDACTLSSNPGGFQSIDTPNGASCLKLHSTPDQNACWVGFDDQNQQSTSVNNLRPLVQNGNTNGVSAGDDTYVDNGNKTPIVAEIRDKMQGNGGYSRHGTDRYLPKDGVADSWVVRLPVIACQDTDHCAGGSPVEIVGAVCFEIREVLPTPEHQLRGRFLCNDSPDPQIVSLYQQFCGGGGSTGSGGCDFGLRADRPVLVQ